MTKTLTVNIPTQPQGHPVEVLGIGIVENGTTVEIPDERVAQFEASNPGLTLEDVETIEYEQAPEGPTKRTGPPPPVEVIEDAPRDEAGLTLNELADPEKTAQPKVTAEPTAAELNAPQSEDLPNSEGTDV
jgi:hypothetical protein